MESNDHAGAGPMPGGSSAIPPASVARAMGALVPSSALGTLVEHVQRRNAVVDVQHEIGERSI